MTPTRRAVTDLDGTLVFTGTGREGVIVDDYGGQRYGLTSVAVLEELSSPRLAEALVVVTTRTSGQFQRLSFSSDIRFALTSNGARLLIHGVESTRWFNESTSMVARAFPPAAIRRVLRLSCERIGQESPRQADEWLFVIVHSTTPAAAAAHTIIRSALRSTGWVAHTSGRKIHVVPRVLDKSLAVERLFRMQGGVSTWCAAGDSAADTMMLARADRAIAPKGASAASHLGQFAHVQVTHHTGLAAATEVARCLSAFIEASEAGT